MKCATAWTRQTLVVTSGPRDDVDNRGGNVESLGRGQGSQTDLDGKLGAVFPQSHQNTVTAHPTLARMGEKRATVLGVLGSGVVASVSGAYTAAVTVVLYFDIRCRKEAFEVEQLARIVEAGTARAAS